MDRGRLTCAYNDREKKIDLVDPMAEKISAIGKFTSM